MAKTIEALYTVDATPEAVAHRAAEYFVDRIQESVDARGKARIAISGGSTPKRTFELLAGPPFRSQIPWEKLELYWVDERAVPPSHPDSNYRMTRLALLDKVPLKDSQIFRIHGELEPDAAAAKYESDIRSSFRLEGAELPTFDSLSLGMGPDGHTASLFPHSAALHELLRIAVANHVPTQKETWRVTLTSPVINQARDVFFVIAGPDKAPALKSVLLGPYLPEDFPSQLIQPKSGRITLLLDSAAAALLPQPGADGRGRLEITR
ncbi:MAG TPA: 6-phosphogluconolactonase [Acidobacteriaceae bacterium]|jgi:6-phosphogluconolactonase